MKPFQGKRGNPEQQIRTQIIKFLGFRGWVTKIVHGGVYQSGFPDLYSTHRSHGPRWIEVKLPGMEGSRFTKEQKEWFPILSQNGTPIWILTAATESEYKKLFGPENWLEYFMLKG